MLDIGSICIQKLMLFLIYENFEKLCINIGCFSEVSSCLVVINNCKLNLI